MSKDLKSYPKTKQFRIKDTIGVPHPYCITPKHIKYAAENWGGMLGAEAIRALEDGRGNCCGVKGCDLTYDHHKQALLVEIRDDRELNDIPELQCYLLSIKDKCEADGYAGFAFLKKENA